jgi:lysophospholipase L1-like esterase
MKRRQFLEYASAGLAGFGSSIVLSSTAGGKLSAGASASSPQADGAAFQKPRDFAKEPFKRFVILGESTVEGGPWLPDEKHDRYADVLVRLINEVQGTPVQYHNKGISNNSISPRSPSYPQSNKPSAVERYNHDVIALKPDLFVLAYGLNDMRGAMPVEDFREDMATIIRDVKKACNPVTVLTTVYYMTGYGSWPPINKGSISLTLKYNECIRSLADEFDCILADVWNAEGGADWLIHYDGVHANLIGNRIIAHRIFEAIAQHSSGLSKSSFARVDANDWSHFTLKERAKAGDPFKKTW